MAAAVSVSNTAGLNSLFGWGGASSSGESVNKNTALSIAAFFNGVTVISEAIASLPWEVYQRNNDGGRNLAFTRPEYYLIHKEPNTKQTAFYFWQNIIIQVLLTGNGYAHIIRDTNGFPISLIYYQSQDVSVYDTGDTVVYKFKGQPELIAAENVIHIPGLGFDGICGKSILSYHADTLGNSLSAKKQEGRLYKNGPSMKGWVETPEAVTVDQVKKLSSSLKAQTQGENYGSMLVLPQALKMHGVSMSQRDMQYVESMSFNVQEIGRMLNIPLHKIKSMAAATRANIEQQNIEFVTDTLRPWVKKIEQELDRKFYGQGSPYFVKANLSALLRGDLTTQTDAFMKGIYAGWYNVNEVRAMLNLNPIDGGDDYLQPTNTYNINQIMADLDKKKAETEKLLAEAESTSNTE